MYQHEFIELLNTRMLQAAKRRNSICPTVSPEERGFWHGKFKTYGEIAQLLTVMDIEQTNLEAPSITPIA